MGDNMSGIRECPQEPRTAEAWETAADKVCDAMLKRAPDMLRKVSGALYEQMLYDVQDYLRDNVEFNLSSLIAMAEARAERDASALAAASWQDISTAPKDGTPIDLWAVRERTGAGRRYTECSWGRRVWGSEEVGEPCWLGLDDQYSPVTPTHWMRIPAPPFGSGRNLADATPKHPPSRREEG